MMDFDLVLGLSAAAIAVGLAFASYVRGIPEDPDEARWREVLAAFERHPDRRNGIATCLSVDAADGRAVVAVSHPETPGVCESWTFRLIGSEWLRTGVFS